MALISQLSVNLNANTRGLEKGFKKARRKVKAFTNSIFNIKTAVAGALGIGGIGAMVGDLVAVNSEFQQLNSGLKTVTGSAEGAAKAFDFIKDFSKTTPFELNEVTDAFIKLKNYGLEPNTRALRAYGNMASAMGKGLNQVIEAVADATSGEMERLKEFGIRGAAIKNSTDKLLTFRGVETRVALKDIQEYLINIAESNFGSAMTDQMKNLGPSFSNLRTAVQDLKIAIGEGGLNTAITNLVTNTTMWIESLDQAAIKEYTSKVIESVANFADIGAELYNYVAGNKFLQWGGLIGFAMFGKLGIGGAVLLDQAASKLGKNIGIAWEQFNPSGITGRTRDFNGGAIGQGAGGYQLGDFNNPNAPKLREMFAEKYGMDMLRKTDEQTNVLNDVADILRGGIATPATAG